MENSVIMKTLEEVGRQLHKNMEKNPYLFRFSQGSRNKVGVHLEVSCPRIIATTSGMKAFHSIILDSFSIKVKNARLLCSKAETPITDLFIIILKATRARQL